MKIWIIFEFKLRRRGDEVPLINGMFWKLKEEKMIWIKLEFNCEEEEMKYNL
jgi:hypothetical protein